MSHKRIKAILGISYGLLLSALTTFVVLETFVIPSVSGTLNKTSSFDLFAFDDSSSATTTSSSGEIASDSSSSETSSNESVMTSSEKADATTIAYEARTYSVSGKSVPYMLVTADLKKISDLRTRVALSSDSYGTNITESFSSLIQEAEQEDGQEVLFALDGDFPFWSGRKGYVVRNGVTYRSSKRSDSSNLDFAIFKDGSFSAYDEANLSFSSLTSMHNGCYQNWCFGPALLVDSSINVSEDQDVSQTKSANQRAAIGIKEDGTFCFLCSDTNDGKRNGSSVGLSLFDMATILEQEGCLCAYNLDGGGSAGMYIKGYGTSGYFMSPERKLGDIIYVVNS